MQHSSKKIQVFEYHSLHYGREYNDVLFEEKHFTALVKLNELHNNEYFTIVNKGIKFKQYVGVIQVDGLTIEILPKIDNNGADENVWQNALIEMLRVTRKLKVQNVGQAHVSKQQIHLLDIYFEWFLNEVQLLIHQGLIKQYYKETGNVKTLKGKLEFAGHISKNLVHKERFYTTHQVYDKDHLVHQILNKALEIVEKCSKGSYLYSKCKLIQLDFPEVSSISVNEATFKRIPKNRKTAPYSTALNIARLIILNFAPNITNGREDMLALLFDMNQLWEEYVLVCLQKAALKETNVCVTGQQSKGFWHGISIRPDIVIEKGIGVEKQTFIIDTKWKNIGNGKPDIHDLRQMYVYNDYWISDKAMLLYPSMLTDFKEDDFKDFATVEDKRNHKCGIGKISVFENDTQTLNTRIGTTILEWFSIIKKD